MSDPGQKQGQSLANRLVPVADQIRAIASRLGLRPYKIFILKGHWTGDRKGFGDLIVDSRCEIVPTPRVRDLSVLNQNIKSTGRVEDGDVYVDEISPRYSEAELMGKTPDLAALDQPRTARPMVEFWWEVEEARADCPDPIIRAFVPRAAPSLRRDQFQWTVVLAKREYDRGGRGDPERSKVIG